jgi:hypothetical protein
MKILILMLCLVAGPVWAIDNVGAVSCEEFTEVYGTDKWDSVKFEYHHYLNGAQDVAERFGAGGKPVYFYGDDNYSELFSYVIATCREFSSNRVGMNFKVAVVDYIAHLR